MSCCLRMHACDLCLLLVFAPYVFLLPASLALEISVSLRSSHHIGYERKHFKGSSAECVKQLTKVTPTDSLKTSYDIREVSHP